MTRSSADPRGRCADKASRLHSSNGRPLHDVGHGQIEQRVENRQQADGEVLVASRWLSSAPSSSHIRARTNAVAMSSDWLAVGQARHQQQRGPASYHVGAHQHQGLAYGGDLHRHAAVGGVDVLEQPIRQGGVTGDQLLQLVEAGLGSCRRARAAARQGGWHPDACRRSTSGGRKRTLIQSKPRLAAALPACREFPPSRQSAGAVPAHRDTCSASAGFQGQTSSLTKSASGSSASPRPETKSSSASR
jgi:hypothetical protein